MRFQSVIVLLVFAAMLATGNCLCLAADDQFPYTAYANSEDVYIRSGPGKNYYPTEKLGKGTPVEVYRHDPGGWYAIRPPQGSFSWVPADSLKPMGDHLATVQRDHTLCFVGTRFSNTHDVHQVRLDKGEKVEILDIKQVGDGDAAQSWCQIAPPSGEFRWVFGKFVDRDLPEGISRPRDEEQASKRRDAFEDRDTSTSLHSKSSTDWTAKGETPKNLKDDAVASRDTWRSSSKRRSGIHARRQTWCLIARSISGRVGRHRSASFKNRIRRTVNVGIHRRESGALNRNSIAPNRPGTRPRAAGAESNRTV